MGSIGTLVFSFVLSSVSSQITDCLNNDSLQKHCIMPNSTGNVMCSGRGECICGMCECNARRSSSAQKFSGRFCECDDYSCPYYFRQICGGNGRCSCGICKCDQGYVGDACECPISAETCMATTGKICNGVGTCTCGVCQCDAHSSFKGPTCEECPACPSKCQQNRDCAMCVVFQTGNYDAETCDRECQHVHIVDRLEPPTSVHVNICQFNDHEDDCRVFFSYEYIERNKVLVKVQATKVCPSPADVVTKSHSIAAAVSHNFVGIVLGVVGGIACQRIPI